jgi:hypothetical protein
MRITCMEDQVCQQDITFQFPLREDIMSVEDICKQLQKATIHLRNIQSAAPEHRMRSLYDLLALYESGASDVCPAEACRRFNVLRATIRNKTILGTFSNIRQQLNSTDQSGIQHVNVPRMTPESSMSSHDHLQHAPSEII